MEGSAECYNGASIRPARCRGVPPFPGCAMRFTFFSLLFLAMFSTPWGVSDAAAATSCLIPDNGFGTVALPPDCPAGYEGPLQISVGLPAATTIDIDAELKNFFAVTETPGGSLGGDKQGFQGELILTMTGTGALAGFNRMILMQVQCETHSGPRTPGLAVQSFPTDFFWLTGSVLGDPDFDDLIINGGTSLAMPSPGHTTISEIGATNFNVESFFDIEYQITFTGAPGSLLEGFGGTTPGVGHFEAGVPSGPGVLCLQPDNGFGTVDLPPLCPPGYDGHMAIETGLPIGTTIELDALFHSFVEHRRLPGRHARRRHAGVRWHAAASHERYGSAPRLPPHDLHAGVRGDTHRTAHPG